MHQEQVRSSIFVMALALFAASRPALALTEHPLPVSGSFPTALTAGPDGALWFVEFGRDMAGRITPGGTVTEFPLVLGSAPLDLVAGPDGNLWLTLGGRDSILRMTPAGVTTEFSAGISPGSTPADIAIGPDGRLWFTENTGNRIGAITTAGVVTEYPGLTSGSLPTGIAAGSDGNLWFTSPGSNRLGRITTAGAVTELLLPSGSGPQDLTSAQDGKLWFTARLGGSIGRIDPNAGNDAAILASLASFAVPDPNSSPHDIASGQDGNVWFTQAVSNQFGRISLTGVITETSLTAGSAPHGIAQGADCQLWIAQEALDRVAVLDTEAPGTPGSSLGIADTGVAEGDSGTANAVFTVTLAPARGSTVQVHFQTADGSATAPGDYLSVSATLTIPPGMTTGSILVPIVGDLLAEGTETFSIALDSPSCASIATGTASGTIQDTDPTPSPTVTRTPAVTQTPTVTPTPTPPPAGSPSPTATKTPLPPSSADGPRLIGPLIEDQTQVAFDNALPEGSLVRLFSFTGGAFFAEARSDAEGRGTFPTDRPLVRVEEIAALNEANGKVGFHRFVEPRPTPTPPAVELSSGTGSTSLLWPLVLLGLSLGFTGLGQRPTARAKSTSGRGD